MFLCIPTVGQKVVVVEGWTFKLYWERRNDSLFTLFDIQRPPVRTFYEDYEGGEDAWKAARLGLHPKPPLRHNEVTLPAGTVLTIDRIYLRKGNEEFDSITFIINGAKQLGKVGAHARVRFWVKLEDVNTGRLKLL